MRVPPVFLLAALLLGATAVAQKPGSAPSKPSAPSMSRPSPSVSRPSPAARPSPAPSFSKPAPSVSKPAPSISRPAPSISRPAPAPRPAATPSVSRPAPVSRPSMPSASNPKPTTTTRPSYTPAPAAPRTNQAPATPRSTTTPSFGTTPRTQPAPSAPTTGGWNTDVDATPRTATPRTGPTFGSASRKPSANATTKPAAPSASAADAVGGSTRGVGSTYGKPGLTPRNELLEMPRSKPAGDARTKPGAVADRYAPKPGAVRATGDAKPVGPVEPIAKPVANDRASWSTKPGAADGVIAAKPRVVDRYDLDKPRLGGMPAGGKPLTGSDSTGAVARPRSGSGIVTTTTTESPRLVSRATGRVNTYSGGYHGNYQGGYNCDPYYYNPWYDRCWNYGLSLSWSFGCSSIGWGWSYPAYYSCWTPYWSWRSSCWYDGWWASWCSPTRAYWWWPTTVYQPVYYTTPATQVVYVEQPAAEPQYVEYVENAPAAVGGPVGAAPGAVARPQPTPDETAAKYVRLGDFYFREGRFAEAVDAYGRARKAMPMDASLCFVQADALFATGDYHQAAFLVGEALRLDPGMARVDTDKRLLYADVKVFEDQLATLRRYLTDKPYDAMAHLVLGYNLKLAMQPEAAAKAFERVLEIEPGNEVARAFLSALREPPRDAIR